MSRFIEANAWAKAPIQKLLHHARTVVNAEVENGTIWNDATTSGDTRTTSQVNNDNTNTSTSVNQTIDAPQHAELVDTIQQQNNEVDRQVNTKIAISRSNRIPRFDPDEIKVGRVIGRGGFCIVSEIREIRLTPSQQQQQQHQRGPSMGSHNTADLSSTTERTNRNNHTNRHNNHQNAKFWKKHSTSDSSMDVSQNTAGSETVGTRAQLAREVWSKPGGKVVMKQVNREFIDTDRATFLKGIIDLAMEAKFLAHLDHPNIIPLRGECRYSPFDTTEYFIILDYLPRTLPHRLNEWMHMQRATKGITGFCTSLGTGNETKKNRLMTDRLLIAYDIAVAGNYLHKKNIVFRDFKPDNIGFTSVGVTKIMDFGLARELTNLERDANGCYNLTGLTGGIRYMAPEVGLLRPYNTNADIYSWSMIFWYMLSLEPPLCLYTPEMIIHRVFEKGHRPATKISWNPALTELLRRCWTDQIHERPTFKEIMKELFHIVHSYDPNVAALMKFTSKNEGTSTF